MDLTRATSIKGFPFYYIYLEDGDENPKIWLYKPSWTDLNEKTYPTIDKEVVPNPTGKVLLKSADGIGTAFLAETIINAWKAAMEDGRAKLGAEEQRVKKREVKDTSHLDPKLVNKRIVLKMKLAELEAKRKSARNFEELQGIRPHFLKAEDELAQFDDEYPEYAPVMKTKLGRATRKSFIQPVKPDLTPELIETLKEKFKIFEEQKIEIAYIQKQIDSLESEFIQFFGSRTAFLSYSSVPEFNLKTYL